MAGWKLTAMRSTKREKTEVEEKNKREEENDGTVHETLAGIKLHAGHQDTRSGTNTNRQLETNPEEGGSCLRTRKIITVLYI